MAAFIAAKVPSLVNVCFRSKCTNFSNEIERGAVSGTGADAQILAGANGGVLDFTTGTTGGSFRIVRNRDGNAAAGTTANLVANNRTSKWAVGGRVWVKAANSGASIQLLRMTDEATANDVYLGVIGSTSSTHWTLTVGSLTVQDTGVAFLNQFQNIARINDGTNISAWNVDAGTQIGSSMSVATVQATAAHPLVLCSGGAGFSCRVWMDDWMVVTDPAS